MRDRSELISVVGLVLGVVVIAWAHVSGGGDLRLFLQPTAISVVGGGTAAALLVSFPWRTLGRAVLRVLEVLTRRPSPPEDLAPTFIDYARQVRQNGVMAIEDDIPSAHDPFLARALSMLMTGVSGDVVTEALQIDARVCAERDEEEAQVFEAAAGYAPTLGIIGAVLGLMHTMQSMSAPALVGTGIAAAFVATIYGIGSANLIFLPLATRLRARARVDGLRRELIIDGVAALRERLHPRLMEERLSGYLDPTRGTESDAA
jgi:chemotaxis protein MotA